MKITRRGRTAGAALAAGALLAGAMAALPTSAAMAKSGGGYSAEIRRTSYGVPHIKAKDYASLGFGNGYVQAEDNVCIIAEQVVTTSGTRSQYLGATAQNLQSDLFFRNIVAARTVERSLEGRADGLHAPSRAARDLVRGFVAGYNNYVRNERVTDPACRNRPWVREVTELDYWRTLHAAAIRAGSRALQGGILAAAPPGAALNPRTRPSAASVAAEVEVVTKAADGTSAGMGSNAYGLGGDATVSGRGMVLSNPHFPWDGPERFYRLHLTIPGKYDVEGAALIGSPMVQIGHNGRTGWSHTVSTARRFVWHQLTLVPGDPTSYLVDGEPVAMTSRTVSVGGVGRTFYDTRFGPVVVVPGQFDWTATSAYAITDVNATNNRLVDGWLAMGKARTVRQLVKALDRHQHLPWVNVIGADAGGEAVYADHSVVPRVTAQLAADCIPALFQPLYATTGQAVLDGSRSSCDLGTDPDAAVAGILPPDELPIRFRDDYVTNSNDSHWLANPEEPLTGFARIIGDEGTQRSLRTRLGILMGQQRLAGTDGLPGRGFTVDRLWRVMFNNRVLGGELVRDDLVAACRATPTAAASDGTVVVLAPACEVLARWDLRADLDSRGAHLFREFVLAGGLVFADPFVVSDPVGTPRQLATGNPAVLRALAEAVRRLDGIPLDAPLGTVQTEARGEEHVPIHGDRGNTGAFNVITAPLVPGVGYPNVEHGASYVMAVELGGKAPTGRQLLAYSQSSNPRSPYYADQTRLYSRTGWDAVKFTDRQINADPRLVRYVVREDRRDCRGDGWRDFEQPTFASQRACVASFDHLG